MCVMLLGSLGVLTSSVPQSRDGEHRKSTGKGGMDASGNLYQYDNYDEVAMETDSETSSPGLILHTAREVSALSGRSLRLPQVLPV